MAVCPKHGLVVDVGQKVTKTPFDIVAVWLKQVVDVGFVEDEIERELEFKVEVELEDVEQRVLVI